MDGEITIGTTLSTDKFDKQIADLEKKMQKEEDKKVVLGAKIEVQEEELQMAIEKTDKLAEAYQRLKGLQDTIAGGHATPQQSSMAQDIQNTYGSMTQLETSFLRALNKQDEINLKVTQLKSKYQEVNDKVSQYKQKIENVKIQKQVADVDKLKNSFNSVGSSIQKSIKNVGRLALGIFGIRSAFMFLRRASSDLANYDQQYATNLEYIRYALTQAIAPVLQWIVSLAAKLLGYINAIFQGWFGINLFSRGSAENFNKMKASTGGISKAVKEIKKQLAGFDEINMLTDQSDTGTSAGAGGVGMPSFDLSAMQGEVPDWLQWIIEHKDEILATLLGIATALTLWKLGLGGIKALGIGLMVTGIVLAIEGLLDYLNDPSWENFGKIIQGVGIAIIGLGVAFLGLPAIIVGVIVLIVGTIIKYWDKIKKFLQDGIDWLADKSDWVHQMFGDTIGNIYDVFVENLQLVLDWFDRTFTDIKQIFDGIIEFIKGVFTGNWEQAWEGIKKIFGGIWDWILTTASTYLAIMLNSVFSIADTIGDIFRGLWNKIVEGAKATWNWIIGIFGNIGNFFKNIVNTIIGFFWNLGVRAGEAVSNAFRTVVNGILRAVENILNSPIRAINSLISVINSVPGIELGYLNTFSLPRLKVGGIVNMPNRGTLVGGAIAGESGKEGVLPLTDTQAMAELGREIGRWININATVPVYVGNRQIAREIKKINAEDDFAYNS